MVLVIVAIATVLTVAMIGHQQQVVRRASTLFNQDQARLYALGAEDFVSELIKEDTRQQSQNSDQRDTLNEPWANPPPFPVPGGLVTARITDAQARFNLNNLVQNGAVNQPAVNFYRRLLRAAGAPDSLVSPLIDWEDADSNPVDSDGAEDDFYSRSKPPYRAANGPLVSLSELYLIRGYTPAIIHALEPYVTVLPKATPINVNTMTPLIAGSLVEGQAANAGEEIIQNRPREGYKTVDELLELPAFAQLAPAQKTELHGLLDVHTNFFELTADAVIDNRHCVLVSVLERGNSDTIGVVSRNYSHRFEPISPPAASAPAANTQSSF